MHDESSGLFNNSVLPRPDTPREITSALLFGGSGTGREAAEGSEVSSQAFLRHVHAGDRVTGAGWSLTAICSLPGVCEGRGED